MSARCHACGGGADIEGDGVPVCRRCVMERAHIAFFPERETRQTLDVFALTHDDAVRLVDRVVAGGSIEPAWEWLAWL